MCNTHLKHVETARNLMSTTKAEISVHTVSTFSDWIYCCCCFYSIKFTVFRFVVYSFFLASKVKTTECRSSNREKNMYEPSNCIFVNKLPQTHAHIYLFNGAERASLLCIWKWKRLDSCALCAKCDKFLPFSLFSFLIVWWWWCLFYAHTHTKCHCLHRFVIVQWHDYAIVWPISIRV